MYHYEESNAVYYLLQSLDQNSMSGLGGQLAPTTVIVYMWYIHICFMLNNPTPHCPNRTKLMVVKSVTDSRRICLYLVLAILLFTGFCCSLRETAGRRWRLSVSLFLLITEPRKRHASWDGRQGLWGRDVWSWLFQQLCWASGHYKRKQIVNKSKDYNGQVVLGKNPTTDLV